MSWIKITHLLPGDRRRIQVWNNVDNFSNEPKGNVRAIYYPNTGKWQCDDGRYCELTKVTHWAELLTEPEDLKQE